MIGSTSQQLAAGSYEYPPGHPPGASPSGEPASTEVEPELEPELDPTPMQRSPWKTAATHSSVDRQSEQDCARRPDWLVPALPALGPTVDVDAPASNRDVVDVSPLRLPVLLLLLVLVPGIELPTPPHPTRGSASTRRHEGAKRATRIMATPPRARLVRDKRPYG